MNGPTRERTRNDGRSHRQRRAAHRHVEHIYLPLTGRATAAGLPGMIATGRCHCGACQLHQDPSYVKPRLHASQVAARNRWRWLPIVGALQIGVLGALLLAVRLTCDPRVRVRRPSFEEWRKTHPPIMGGASTLFLIGATTSPTTSWSLTSGGASAGVVPTSADTVKLDANSPATTMNANLTCLTFDCTGYTHLLTWNSPVTLTVAGTVCKFVSTMTVSVAGAGSAISLIATTGTVTINSGGKQLGNITCAAVTNSTATYSFVDSILIGAAATLTLTSGILDLSGAATHSVGNFNANNSNVKTLTITGSSITCTGTGNAWSLGGGTSNTTFNASGSTITITGTSAIFAPGQFNTTTAIGTYNNIVFSGAGVPNISLPGNIAPTITSLTRTATAVKTDGLSITATTMTNLICTTLTLNSNAGSVLNGLQVLSATPGSSRTLTVGTLVTTGRIDFQDITGAGAATWTTASGATYFGDCLGNSGITFTTAAPQTWSGNTTGNASTAANWTSRVPLPQDNVTVSGLTSGTITFDMPRIGANVDFTGSSGGTAAFSSVATSAFGNWKFVAGVTMSGTQQVTLAGRGSQTITSAAVTWTTAIIVTAPGGNYTLQDNLTCNRSSNPALQANIGTLIDGGKSVTLSGGSSAFSANAAGNLTASGVWTLQGTGTVWTANASSTMTMTGSTITLSDTSATGKTFAGGGKAYGILSITGGGTGSVTITGSNSFSGLPIGPKSIVLTSGTTQTITSAPSWMGSAGNLITFTASTPGAAATISVPSGTVVCDYLSLKDSTATGGATFYAGPHSTSVSGNTGWTFSQAPLSGSDSASFSDAGTTGAVSHPRAGSDTVVISDAGVRSAQAWTASGADSLTPSDSPARAAALTRAGADTAPMTESGARGAALVRSGSDAVTASEAGSETSTRSAFGSDSVTFSETGARGALSLARAGSDSTPINESGSMAQALARAGADALTVSESGAGHASTARGGTDTATLADVAIRTTTASVGGHDSLAVTDQPAGQTSAARFAADTVTITDGGIRTMTGLRTGQDAAAVTDGGSTTVARVRFASDSIVLADSAQAVVRLAPLRDAELTVAETVLRLSVRETMVVLEVVETTTVLHLHHTLS